VLLRSLSLANATNEKDKLVSAILKKNMIDVCMILFSIFKKEGRGKEKRETDNLKASTRKDKSQCVGLTVHAKKIMARREREMHGREFHGMERRVPSL
jgi:hypothetical protein